MRKANSSAKAEKTAKVVTAKLEKAAPDKAEKITAEAVQEKKLPEVSEKPAAEPKVKTAAKASSAKKSTAKAEKTAEAKPLDFHKIVALVKKTVKKTAVKKVGCDVAAEVSVTGEGEGVFYIEVKEGALSIEPYSYIDKDLAITVSSADLIALAEKKVKAEQLIKEGRLEVYGSLTKAVKLAALFA